MKGLKEQLDHFISTIHQGRIERRDPVFDSPYEGTMFYIWESLRTLSMINQQKDEKIKELEDRIEKLENFLVID